jgi:murein L,D-transpeptidase YcbB/YkuD
VILRSGVLLSTASRFVMGGLACAALLSAPALAGEDALRVTLVIHVPAPSPAANGETAIPVTGLGAYPNLRQLDILPEPPIRPTITAKTDGASVSASVTIALRGLLQGDRSQLARPARVTQQDVDTVAAYYARRDFRPLWVDGQGWTRAGAALVDRINRAEDDGLERADYAIEGVEGDAMARARAEIAATLAAFGYARDARGGRVRPVELSKLMTAKPVLPSVEMVMTAIEDAPDADVALQAFNPQHAGYIGLRRKLIEMRETTAALPIARNPVRADGPRTPSAAPVSAGEIIANMERWRWLPQELGARRIMVNIPEYTMRLYDGAQVTHAARIVVGKVNSQTPVFSELMEYVVVNPSWGVPNSILKREFLPKLAADPNWAAQHGYQVVRNGERIVGIRQPPGERNALGFIKFMFPNEHAVYLHDTPQRALFARDERAFSHGCVRVDQPFALATALLGDMGYDEERLKALIGKGERTIHLREKVPVHLTYFTLSVDQDGTLHRFADIYGHDQKVRMALAQTPHRVATLR